MGHDPFLRNDIRNTNNTDNRFLNSKNRRKFEKKKPNRITSKMTFISP